MRMTGRLGVGDDVTERTIEEDDDRPRGIPAPGHLGASWSELVGGLLGLLVLVLIGLAFWFGARP